jgi:hypothetical protein
MAQDRTNRSRMGRVPAERRQMQRPTESP